MIGFIGNDHRGRRRRPALAFFAINRAIVGPEQLIRLGQQWNRTGRHSFNGSPLQSALFTGGLSLSVGEPAVDSNPVDVLLDRKRLIVADAGGNTLLEVRKHGSIDVLSVFENRDDSIGSSVNATNSEITTAAEMVMPN